MAAVLVLVAVYARVVGAEELTADDRRRRRPDRRGAGRRTSTSARCASALARLILPVFTALAVLYLFLPIAVMIAFSFNDPRGRQNITWQGFTIQNYLDVWNRPDITGPMVTSLIVAVVSTIIATILGTLIGLALTRYQFSGRGALNLLIYLPMATPEIILGASLLALWVTVGVQRGIVTIIIAHVMFNISFVVVTLRARIAGFNRIARGGGDGPRRRRVDDVPQGDLPADLPGHPRRRRCSPSRCRSTTTSSPRSSPARRRTFPLWVFGASPPRRPAGGQRARHAHLRHRLHLHRHPGLGPAAGTAPGAGGAVSGLRISQAAEAVGASPSALRRWEREGLVRPRRSESGYRVYSPDDVARLRAVRRMRRVELVNGPGIRRLLARARGSASRIDGARLRRLRESAGPRPARRGGSVRHVGQPPVRHRARQRESERRRAPAHHPRLRHHPRGAHAAPTLRAASCDAPSVR